MPQQRKLEHSALCYVLLALITVAIYLPVVELSFVTFDDTYYLTNNPKVQAELRWNSVRWAFTRAHAANWHPSAQYHLAEALASQHKTQEAIKHYREALKILPDFAEALNNLAWILAANPDAHVREGRQAVVLAERACKLTGYKQPIMVGTLAAAYAEAGRFDEAVTNAEKAKTMAEQANQMELAAKNRALLDLYLSGQPARDTP